MQRVQMQIITRNNNESNRWRGQGDTEKKEEKQSMSQQLSLVTMYTHMRARGMIAPQGLGNASRIGIVEVIARRIDLRDVRVTQLAQHNF